MSADAALLDAAADWCDRYTPLVAIDAPYGLILDISGCAHLFGGEGAMLRDVVRRLERAGLRAEAAVASEAGTAQALVSQRPQMTPVRRIVATGDEAAHVAPLALASLRLAPEMIARLARLGLSTLGDLADLPRPSLVRRFGADLLTRLDRAFGRAGSPISPRIPVPALSAERRLFEPVSLQEDIERLVLALAERLTVDLATRCEGGRRFDLALFRVDGKVERVGVATAAPLRDPLRIARLFRERLTGIGDAIDVGFGFDLVRLSVAETAAVADRQTSLAGGGANGEALSDLVDRLGARLGENTVLTAQPVQSHRPERAERRHSLLGAGHPASGQLASDAAAATPPLLAPRPVRLLGTPEPVEAAYELPDGAPLHFRWRKALHRVRRAEGPERIAPEWWRDPFEGTRDYYRVEDEAGRRFWLFRVDASDALDAAADLLASGEEDFGDREDFEDGAEDGAAASVPEAGARDDAAAPADPGAAAFPAFAAPAAAGAARPSWYMHGIFA